MTENTKFELTDERHPHNPALRRIRALRDLRAAPTRVRRPVRRADRPVGAVRGDLMIDRLALIFCALLTATLGYGLAWAVTL